MDPAAPRRDRGASPSPRGRTSRSSLPAGPRPGRGAGHASAPGPLPLRPGHAVCRHWPARAGPCRIVEGDRNVPRHVDDLMAATNRGGAGAGGRVMTIKEGNLTWTRYTPPNTVAGRAMVFPVLRSMSGHRERRRVTRLPGSPRGRRFLRCVRLAIASHQGSTTAVVPPRARLAQAAQRGGAPCHPPVVRAVCHLSPRPGEWRARRGIPRRCSGRCAHGRSGLRRPARRRGRAVACSRPQSQIPRRLTN